MEDEAYNIFAELHPIEAFELDNNKFHKFMKTKGYNITVNEILNIIKEMGSNDLKEAK